MLDKASFFDEDVDAIYHHHDPDPMFVAPLGLQLYAMLMWISVWCTVRAADDLILVKK